MATNTNNFTQDVRSYNIGKSNYSAHKHQPWDIWKDYVMNPWDCDITKRILRTKEEGGMTPTEARKLDYEKIIHISRFCISLIDEGEYSWVRPVKTHSVTAEELRLEYGLHETDGVILGILLKDGNVTRDEYLQIIDKCTERIAEL